MSRHAIYSICNRMLIMLLLLFFSHTGTQSIQKCFTHLLHSKGQQHSSNDFSSDSNKHHTYLAQNFETTIQTRTRNGTDHLQLYCYSRTYPHAHSSRNTPYYYNTNTVIQRIYMVDAATPYLEDLHDDLQRNIIHLHALRAIVICQHAAQEKQHNHTAHQQLATQLCELTCVCSSPINIDIHAQEQHTHISQTGHSLRTLAIFPRHGRAIALFTLHATGKSLTTEGSAEGTAG